MVSRRNGGGDVEAFKQEDATNAGTATAEQCTLVLTEGGVAKGVAISGLSVVGRDYYGVFPLKGKLLNVREASDSQILKNEEIQNLVKIMGLKYGQKYESTKSLRYGHLMIMTDQDHDGSHIKGLVINFIHHFWPSLLEIEGFLQEFITPIVKCTKGRTTPKVFYTMPEYEVWQEANDQGRGWNIKCYEGLGTCTFPEAKEYFYTQAAEQRFHTIPEYEVWRENNNQGRGWNLRHYKRLGTFTTAEAKEYFVQHTAQLRRKSGVGVKKSTPTSKAKEPAIAGLSEKPHIALKRKEKSSGEPSAALKKLKTNDAVDEDNGGVERIEDNGGVVAPKPKTKAAVKPTAKPRTETKKRIESDEEEEDQRVC